MVNPRNVTVRHLASLCAAIALVFVACNGCIAQATPQERQAKAQANLQKEVRHVLITQPTYTVFDNLAYNVNGDRVTLYGQVVSTSLKSDAEKSVKSIEGVSAVDNQIEVLPPAPGDDQIRRAEFRAIYSAPGMEKYSIQAVPPIHIIVKNGNVTLAGAVANQTDKTLVAARANSVPGVFSVKNELSVDK